MQPAEPREFGMLQPGDHAEDAALLAMPELRLEADHVVERAERVILAQLHDGVRAMAGLRVAQADRLHRPKAQGIGAARRHHFDREAALEIGRRFFPLVKFDFLAGEQCRDKRFVFVAFERTIDVIRDPAARPNFIVARLKPRRVEIDRIAMHDRRDCVEKRQRFLAGQLADRLGQSRRGQRTGRNDDFVPLGRRQPRDLLAAYLDKRLRNERRFDRLGKPHAVDRQRAPRRHLVRVGRAQDQRAALPHLFVQQADRVLLRIVRAEGIGADELGQARAEMRLGLPHRPHLVQHHRHPGARHLPRRLAAGQPATDHMHRFHAELGAVCGPATQAPQWPQGMIGTVEIAFCGEPSMILSLIAR